jgi:type IX secretion system PorP/SprF family membrane protein
MYERFMCRFVKVYLFILFFPTVVFSQQDAMYSHYMFNNMAINPAYAGSTEEITATLLHRMQWVGWDKAPTTSVFNVHSPFKLFKQNHGVGITIINDALGFNKNLGMNISYAYRINMNNGAAKLSFGISGGFQNQALDATWNVGENKNAGDDPNIPLSKETAMTYDIGFGVFYKTENIYFGASATHLSQSAIKLQNMEVTLKRHYYLTAGYIFALPNNPAFEFQPSVLISSDAVSSKIDINTIVQYNKRLWGGVTYRPGISLTGMLGIQLLNGIKVGYAYDYSTTDIRKYNTGSHEIMVSYGFSIIKEKLPHKYRSIRFL